MPANKINLAMEIEKWSLTIPTQSEKASTLPSALQPSTALAKTELERAVEAAASGYTVGAMVRADAVNAALFIRTEIKFCASTYCAATNTENSTLDECARLVSLHYTHLSPDEIREAFRLAAIGTLDVDLNSYHGLFSVRMLGSVLSAYDDHRTYAARQIRARMKAEEDEKMNEARARELRAQVPTVEELYSQLVKRNTQYRTWHDVPGWFARLVVSRDLPGFSLEEKGEAWRNAKHYVCARVGAYIEETKDRDQRRRYIAARDKINSNPDYFPDELKTDAEEVYSKTLTFSKIANYEQQAEI